MDNDYKIKSSVLKSIMNNPNLRRVITDSLSAPIGSTKRTKAQSILSAFNKVASKKRNDGQGGPSLITANPATFNFNAAPTPQIQTPTYSNIKIFPSTPEPNNTFSNWTNLYSSLPSQFKSSSPSVQDIISKSSVIKPGASISGKTSPFNNSPEKILSSINKSAGNSPLAALNPTNFGQAVGKETLQSLMKTLNSLNASGQPSAIGNKQTATGNTATNSNVSKTDSQNETYYGPATTDSNIQGSTNVSGDYSGDAAIQAQWDSLSPEDQKRFKPVFDAAYSKLGAGTFFYGAMSDKKLLKQLFPGLDDKDLPTGASLSGQMADLQSTLKKQYGLDTLLAEKTRLANESQNFTQDMTDYISGRDEFLGSVNRMIEDAESKSINISTPYAADTMKNYLSYLYTLKGRQNKNYVDYLNTAINYQNNKIQQVDSEYTNMLNAYNTEFKTMSDIKKEDYTQWYTVLTDMYNKLDGSLASQLDLQQKQADIDKTYASIAIDTANASGKLGSIDTSQNPTIKDLMVSSETDTKGQLLPGVDLASVLARAQDQGLDTQGVIDTYQLGAKNSILASKGSMESLNTTINDIVNTLRSLNASTDGEYADIVNNIAQGLGQQTQSSLSTYVNDNSKSIVNAIHDLGGRKGSTLSDFIKNHQDLDSTVATQLFNYYKSNPEYSDKPEMLFSSTGKITDSDIPQIKDIIAKSLASTWANNITTLINQY